MTIVLLYNSLKKVFFGNCFGVIELLNEIFQNATLSDSPLSGDDFNQESIEIGLYGIDVSFPRDDSLFEKIRNHRKYW